MMKNEAEEIEALANEMEVVLETDYDKKDMKEKRAVTKSASWPVRLKSSRQRVSSGNA